METRCNDRPNLASPSPPPPPNGRPARSYNEQPPPPHRRRRRPCRPAAVAAAAFCRESPALFYYFSLLLALAAFRSCERGDAFALLGSPTSPPSSSSSRAQQGATTRTTAAAPRTTKTTKTIRIHPVSSSLLLLKAYSSQSEGLEPHGGGGGGGADDDDDDDDDAEVGLIGEATSTATTPHEMLDRTRRQLETMMMKTRIPQDSRNRVGGGGVATEEANVDPFQAEREQMCREYVAKPAHQLQAECRTRGLLPKGRKPDLAERLARNDLYVKYGSSAVTPSTSSASSSYALDDVDDELEEQQDASIRPSSSQAVVITRFGPLTLSPAASRRLTHAGFVQPTSIQDAALPILAQRGSNAILHSETGSGKTLAFLLPFTERLWKPQPPEAASGVGVAFVLTPTRELALQVAKIAASLCPPGTVRFVSHPTHLLRPDRVVGMLQEQDDESAGSASTRLYVGSATAIAKSLFGSPELPAPPTPKPLAIQLLQNCRYVVLDEVDRLLLGSGGALGLSAGKRKKRRTNNNSGRDASDFAASPKHVHEKPAAVVAAAIMRHSLGKAQVVAASATVGRPLRRELARVLGLTPEECPPVVRGIDNVESNDSSSSAAVSASDASTRAVTIPESVRHYVYEVKSTEAAPSVTSGALLAATYQVIQRLPNTSKTLVVLTRGFGISTQNAVGALLHFGCQPRPQSLMDSLQSMDPKVPPPFPTTSGRRDNDMEVAEVEVEKKEKNIRTPPSPSQEHVDIFSSDSDDGYLLVTGEDTVRGLDLDGLDVVLVVGRPNGVDEYTHIAGRTGRAGRPGVALSVVESAAPFLSWETMLRCQFTVLATPDDVRHIEVS
jgi:DEAD/DEAH box helicase/Helicase conserved C-terminal domain